MAARVREMTSGKPAGLILLFALPLMLGNVFQQMYTMVDLIIVGQFVGVQALAALGVCEWINWLVQGTVSGFTQGFSISSPTASALRTGRVFADPLPPPPFSAL